MHAAIDHASRQYSCSLEHAQGFHVNRIYPHCYLWPLDHRSSLLTEACIVYIRAREPRLISYLILPSMLALLISTRGLMRRSTGLGTRRALLLALVLAAMGSCVTRGVRTTPSSAVDALQPGKTTAPSGTASHDDYGGQQAPTPRHQGQEAEEDAQLTSLKERAAVTGSRLPDCAHACGPCAPCKRVMVSFRCVDEAESCPLAYRCMCRGRFFRVPTL